METRLYTFIDIFNTSVDSDGEEVQIKKIVIPIIQRDYAQGREDPEINRIRSRFLSSLREAIVETPTTLDFVYGDVDADGTMIPLDGQQRLTTLFLLHWYAAKKEEIGSSETEFLKCFSYETRYSARDFCTFLVDFTPSFTGDISGEIVNQAWFPYDWKKDPTISSMLVMINDIDEVFADVSNIWAKLKSGAISFYFLPIKDMGLTDDLYIKLNSRGKPLTSFEHFKAELEHQLRIVDPETSKRLLKKIDIDWTDLLWKYRGDNNIIDDEFLRYFKFICDVICYQNGNTPQGRSSDEFDLLQEYFSADTQDVLKNALMLEEYFDCWKKLGKETPDKFFSRFISCVHEEGKIRIESRYDIDIFEDCLRNNTESSGRRRPFPLNRFVLLYAFISYLLHKDMVTEEQFSRRLRVVNNLVLNSEDEISDSEARSSGNRMPAILAQVDSIIIRGVIDTTLEKNFVPSQIEEEIDKLEWTKENPDKAERLFVLEDHPLLQGQISIVGLDNFELFPRFESLFECDYDLIDSALMSIGFYGQREQKYWRYQLGSGSRSNTGAWKSLFHKSRNAGFENTRSILIMLLQREKQFNDIVLDAIRREYISECEINNCYEWRYYYVKYSVFRPSRYGKYYNPYNPPEAYMYMVMQTQDRVSSNTYNPFLKAADADHLIEDSYGEKLLYSDVYVICENNAYVIYNRENNVFVERVDIPRDENGVDTCDRIVFLKKLLSDRALI